MAGGEVSNAEPMIGGSLGGGVSGPENGVSAGVDETDRATYEYVPPPVIEDHGGNPHEEPVNPDVKVLDGPLGGGVAGPETGVSAGVDTAERAAFDPPAEPPEPGGASA